MKELLSIREFSKFSGIESSTLRYWDEIGLFSPAERGSDNDYRYYSPEQVTAVNFVKIFSNLNVPLKIISEIGEDRTPDSTAQLIEQQERFLNMEMRRLGECHSIIHTRRELISRGDSVKDVSYIGVEHLEEMHFIAGPRNDFQDGEGFYKPFMEYCKQAQESRVNLGFPIAAMHDDWSSFVKAPGSPDFFMSMDPTGNQKSAAGDYVVGYVRGYYGQFGDLPERMVNYIKEHSLTPSGPTFSLYLHDETCISDPSQYLAQVYVAISSR